MVVGVIALLEGETLCARVLYPYSGTLCTPPVDSLSDDPPGALESLVASPECGPGLEVARDRDALRLLFQKIHLVDNPNPLLRPE